MIKELEKEFKFRKNLYRRIENENGVYVYAVHNYEAPNPSYYEIFLREEIPERKAFGKLYPAQVKYPSDNDFGKWAWCCSNWGSVERIKKEIINNNRLKINYYEKNQL